MGKIAQVKKKLSPQAKPYWNIQRAAAVQSLQQLPNVRLKS